MLCAKNDAESCYELGSLYAGGRGVPKDAEKANQLWEKACTRGQSRNGCTALGIVYLEGTGGPKRLAEAEKVLSATCARECVPACLRLASYLMLEAEPARRDTARAVWLISKACLADDVPSCVRACRAGGLALAKGQGGPADEAEAKRALTLACDGWDGEACSALADLAGGKKTPERKALRKKAGKHAFGPACR
jgi:TPR repeat protein